MALIRRCPVLCLLKKMHLLPATRSSAPSRVPPFRICFNRGMTLPPTSGTLAFENPTSQSTLPLDNNLPFVSTKANILGYIFLVVDLSSVASHAFAFASPPLPPALYSQTLYRTTRIRRRPPPNSYALSLLDFEDLGVPDTSSLPFAHRTSHAQGSSPHCIPHCSPNRQASQHYTKRKLPKEPNLPLDINIWRL
jgi:hypothetical protein